ncbi:MAG: ATP-binding protein [Patescibacteria group bacterium]|nr:ATP-binding protein [Patescibacteria group bacterium]
MVIAYTALTTGIGCYLFSDEVLCGGAQLGLAAGLDDHATNYLGALKEIVTDLHDLSVRKSIVAALQRVNPSVASVELNDIQQPGHIVVGHKLNGRILPLQLSQESAGFRRFYAYLLALYQRPSKQTLLFEHPEDGIHPGALSLLAEEFNAAPVAGRGQVLLTTHSPKLLDHFDAEQIRVVELDGLETRIGFVSDEQKEAIHEKLMDAGELLTVDPARMQLEATGA